MFSTRLAVGVLLVLSFAIADVEFTIPSPGAVINGTSLHVEWKESGIAPPLTEIASYSMFLCAGGNNETDFLVLSELITYNTFQTGYSWTGAISTGWGANNTNAYFLKMISSVCDGTVTNYSPRFTLSSMTGSFPAIELAAIPGGTKGPDTVKQGINPSACTTYFTATPSSSSSASSATATNSGETVSATTTNAPASTAFTNASASTISLSKSALAGIIIGAILGFIVIAGVLFVIFVGARKRLARSSNNTSTRLPWNPFYGRKNHGQTRLTSTDAVNELDTHAVSKELEADTTRTGRQEIVGTPISETVGTPVSELPVRKSIYEMAG